jgi:hypothetical protein
MWSPTCLSHLSAMLEVVVALFDVDLGGILELLAVLVRDRVTLVAVACAGVANHDGNTETQRHKQHQRRVHFFFRAESTLTKTEDTNLIFSFKN